MRGPAPSVRTPPGENDENGQVFGTGARRPCYGTAISSCGVRDVKLLRWALIAFVISLIAGGLGFTGIASGARSLAKILFGIFLAIAVVILIVGVFVLKAAF